MKAEVLTQASLIPSSKIEWSTEKTFLFLFFLGGGGWEGILPHRHHVYHNKNMSTMSVTNALHLPSADLFKVHKLLLSNGNLETIHT